MTRLSPQHHLAWYVATLGGLGRLPIAPGTWGSLVALPSAWILISLGQGPWLFALIMLIIILIGIVAADQVVKRYGKADPSEVVIDELAGQWLALLPLPLDPIAYGLAFLGFRLADILKPWPANWAEQNLDGGWGIMADDLIAALYIVLPYLAWTWIMPI